MNEYLSRLNPVERRFVVGVAMVLFVVMNLFWVWPHFSDWGNLKHRLDGARKQLAGYEAVIQQRPSLEAEVRKLEGEGAVVAAEDQATEFFKTIQTQAMQDGVNFIGNTRPTTRTNNQFFVEQVLTVQVQATEKQLVDFLYNLGSANSMIRVRSLSVRPEASRQQLSATITLVASYQKNPKVQTTPPSTAQPAAPAVKAAATKAAAPPAGGGSAVKPATAVAEKPGAAKSATTKNK